MECFCIALWSGDIGQNQKKKKKQLYFIGQLLKDAVAQSNFLKLHRPLKKTTNEQSFSYTKIAYFKISKTQS